jgi:hypothetical protein
LHVAENTFIEVDIEELNGVFRTNGHTKVNENNISNKINIENYDGRWWNRKKRWFLLICTTLMYNAINCNVIFMDKINFNVMKIMFIYY